MTSVHSCRLKTGRKRTNKNSKLTSVSALIITDALRRVSSFECGDQSPLWPAGSGTKLLEDNSLHTERWPKHRRVGALQRGASPRGTPMNLSLNLPEWFGGIDIYLFDQLLKGRLTPGMRLLDAGSGSGRNLPYFLRHGFDVCAVDAVPGALEQVRQLAGELAPHLPAANF